MLRKLLPLASILIKNNVSNRLITKFSTVKAVRITSFCVQEDYFQTIQVRNFAKGKDKKKDKAKNKKVVIDENEIGEVVDVEKLKSEMSDAIQTLRQDYIHKISLRSTTGGLDTLRFSYKGEKMDLLEVAKINRSNDNMVIIDLANSSHLLPTIIKVISTSDMNLNAQQDGSSIIVPIPQVTQQYKESLSKSAKAMFIKCRDLIKDSQNKYLKILKTKSKDGVSEDIIHRVSDQIIFMGNSYISDAEKLLQKKQEELTC